MSLNLKILLLFLILIVSWIFLAPVLARNLIVEKPLIKADAIVVLSGSSAYLERTKKAASVYKQEIASRIVLTDDGGFAGWSQTEQRNPRFVELAKKELIAQGVAEDDIEILSPEVSGTIYEARLIKTKIEKEKWRSIILVTSSFHSRRALWTFDTMIDAGDVNFGVVYADKSSERIDISTWWLGSRGWRQVGGEYVKFIGYWLFY